MTRPDATVNESSDPLSLLYDAPLSRLNYCAGEIAAESGARLSSSIAVLPICWCRLLASGSEVEGRREKEAGRGDAVIPVGAAYQ